MLNLPSTSHWRRRARLLALLAASTASTAFAQNGSPGARWLVEVGGGHNVLFWESIAVPRVSPRQYVRRGHFSPTPEVRVRFEIPIMDDATVAPFLAFTRFGGSSDAWPNGYRDAYWFDALGAGVLAGYRVGAAEAAVGVRYQRHVKMFVEYFGSAADPAGQPRTWMESSTDFLFRNGSVDVGVRVALSAGRWSAAAEVWTGVTRLEDPALSEHIKVSHLQFRLLVGFVLVGSDGTPGE